MTIDSIELGMAVEVVATNTVEIPNGEVREITKIRGTVSHLNGDGTDRTVWVDAESAKLWWSDEPERLARVECIHPHGPIGFSPTADANKYQVRIDSNDGFCNPVGELKEYTVGQVIA